MASRASGRPLAYRLARMTAIRIGWPVTGCGRAETFASDAASRRPPSVSTRPIAVARRFEKQSFRTMLAGTKAAVRRAEVTMATKPQVLDRSGHQVANNQKSVRGNELTAVGPAS